MRTRYALVWALLLSVPTHASTPGSWSAAGSMSSSRSGQTATLLASGKVLIATDSSNGPSTDIFDPASGTWTTGASMHAGRAAASASLLGNGKVLVAGGNLANNCTTTVFASQTNVVCYASATAEMYTPSGNVWNAAHALGFARQGHTATVLASGKVLVAGGASDCTTATTPTTQVFYCTYVASAELYDPASDSWASAGAMVVPRVGHAATLLANGKVLIDGGSNGVTLANAEIYDPATNSFTAAANLGAARSGHTATLLPSGKVYVSGGNGASGLLASTELFDPVSGTWGAGASLSTARFGHTATLLTSGEVLIAGGGSGSDIYKPESNTDVTASEMLTPRSNHTATLLGNGQVLAVGGYGASGTLSSAELFDMSRTTYTVTAIGDAHGNVTPPVQTVVGGGSLSITVVAAGASTLIDVLGDTCSLAQTDAVTWTTGAIDADCAITARFLGPMSASPFEFTTTLLGNGKLLVAGGRSDNQAQLYDPSGNTWSSGGTMTSTRYGHTATLLPNGKVLVAGGTSDGGNAQLASCEVYDPATNSWSTTGSMSTPRANHVAALLVSTGKVLAAGSAFGGPTGRAELYDPSTGQWAAAGPPHFDRGSPQLAVLQSGKLLLFGGGSLTSEVYTPSTNTWIAGGNQPAYARMQAVVVLASGKVLAMGGQDSMGSSVTTSALYDPLSNTWTAGPNLASPRELHTATLMPSGKALVLGGVDFSTSVYTPLASVEQYDPTTNAWTAVTPLTTARFGHTATVLPNGRIFVAGGDVTGSPTAEFYGALPPNTIFRNGFE